MESKLVLAALLFVSVVATWDEIICIKSYKETVSRIEYIEKFERTHRFTFLIDPYHWKTNIPIEKDFHPDTKEFTIYNL